MGDEDRTDEEGGEEDESEEDREERQKEAEENVSDDNREEEEEDEDAEIFGYEKIEKSEVEQLDCSGMRNRENAASSSFEQVCQEEEVNKASPTGEVKVEQRCGGNKSNGPRITPSEGRTKEG